ncbi:hypothetical protein L2750_04735 [Shewanella submarina]|uniref:Uncharacterized protein n=1 Tax=Shewanella submarina TaxID=2016376 RepID=A0ABV7GKS7_9GAMM|nr:hypothetical protein [Shewanella submarina]MCL1036457.1 hypothetical protein [Shewanella submarina]
MEEKLYELVVEELQSGKQRMGIWAKALSLSGGNQELAKAKYIDLRVQSIRDEQFIAKQNSRRNDHSINQLIEKARKKNANFQDLKTLCTFLGLSAVGKKGLFRDSWKIKDANNVEHIFNDSDDLEAFLVARYDNDKT